MGTLYSGSTGWEVLERLKNWELSKTIEEHKRLEAEVPVSREMAEWIRARLSVWDELAHKLSWEMERLQFAQADYDANMRDLHHIFQELSVLTSRVFRSNDPLMLNGAPRPAGSPDTSTAPPPGAGPPQRACPGPPTVG